MIVCAASCGNKKAAKEGECANCDKQQVEAAAPAAEAAKTVEEQVSDAAKEAAVDVAKTGIDAAADAAKEAIKK